VARAGGDDGTSHPGSGAVGLTYSLLVAHGSPAVHHFGESESYALRRSAALRRLRMKPAEVRVGEVRRQANYARVEPNGRIVFKATGDEDGAITVDKEVLP
jgi:hypothetical protein